MEVPKSIILTGKILQFVSPKLTTQFAARLFITPFRHKLHKREYDMDKNSIQKTITVTAIAREIKVYEYGTGEKTILLAHGWSGRGTQLVKIADAFVKAGYRVISFDAPAHGKAPGKTTQMNDFIEAILYLEKYYGSFYAAVGHSLGGMSLLNAVKKGLSIKKLVTIGSGDIISDIVSDFVFKLQLKEMYASKVELFFEKKFQREMNSFSSSVAAKDVSIPVLIIHDEDDTEIPLDAAKNIHKNLKNSELLITKKLGHRKILGNGTVIDTTYSFIEN